MALSSNSCQTAWIIFFLVVSLLFLLLFEKIFFSPIIFWIFKFPPPHDCRKSVHSACTASRALPVSIGTFYFVHSCQYLPCCRPRNYSLPLLGGILQWSVTGKGWFFSPSAKDLRCSFPCPLHSYQMHSTPPPSSCYRAGDIIGNGHQLASPDEFSGISISRREMSHLFYFVPRKIEIGSQGSLFVHKTLEGLNRLEFSVARECFR